MKVHYSPISKEWYQTSLETMVTFGGEQTNITYQKQEDGNSICFELRLKNNHAGPLVGIVAARKADGVITGNSALFVKLQKKLTSQGGFSFIFTPEDAGNKYITGYTFLPESCSWEKINVPYPDLVYNRIPFRKLEQEERCRYLFSILNDKKIPFFNPCFLDKYELYCLFQKNPLLQNFLPATDFVDSREKLDNFLKKYQRVYLKPSQSAKGKGIFRLSLESPSGVRLVGLKRQETYPSLQTFWEHWETLLLRESYIVQKEINPGQFQGKRYDFRVLAHAKKDGYSVTGIGVRQAQEQDLTTHIPNGGRLIRYELVQSQEHDDFIKTVVAEIGPVLSARFGYFGEFSLDAGISRDGNYYIYEVNSKPMSFDESVIEDKKIAELCRLFHELSGFER